MAGGVRVRACNLWAREERVGLWKRRASLRENDVRELRGRAGGRTRTLVVRRPRRSSVFRAFAGVRAAIVYVCHATCDL